MYDYVLNIRRRYTMKNNRRQAQFLINGISDNVPQLLLEENELVFKDGLKEDVLIPLSSITGKAVLQALRFYLLIESIIPLLDF